MTTIDKIIAKNKLHVFRRMYMKRRISGDYEASWQRVPDRYIIKFGSVEFAIDDIKVNFYRFSGYSFTIRNDDGYFSDQDNEKSFFYGAEERYRTLVKIEAGYLDTDSTEYPTTSTMYVGLLNEDIIQNEKNEINFTTKHISSVFDEVPATNIPGLTGTLTASEIITKIKGYTDGSNNLIFQKYITSSGWHYSNTTANYVMATDTTLDGMSCWELMKKIAEAENRVIYVDKVGDLYFQEKLAATSTATYHLHGLGDDETNYGHNIKKIDNVDYSIRKVYNRIRLKFQEEDTLTSYYKKEETWAWGDSSSSYMYGIRTYEMENSWIQNTATAITIANAIYQEYYQPKTEVNISAKFLPHVFVNDRVSMTYKTHLVQGDYLWGTAVWGAFVWGEDEGYNLYFDNVDHRITKITHNLDKFETKATLREI